MDEGLDVAEDASARIADPDTAEPADGAIAEAAPIGAAPPASPTPDVTATLVRWMQYDVMRPFAFFALAALYVLSRAPLLDNGYGTKPDAWRIALSGYWLWEHGQFYPSRLPGYPIPELSYAAVFKGGWVATNSLTVLVSLVGVWFFAGIVRRLRLPNPALLTVGFAFTPLLWINSMNTMDYTWALTFILGSYYFLLADNDLAAGIMLGLAIGSRIPSAAMIVPFVVHMWRSGKRDEIRTYIVAAVAVALIAFLPIIWRYGPDFFNFYDAKIYYTDVIRLLAKDSLGLAGSAALAIAFIVSLPRIRHLPADFLHDKDVMTWVIAIVLVAFTFARLPHEAAYLIPLFPFAYLLAGKYFQRWALAGAIVVIVLAGFVDFTTTNHEVSASSIRHLRVGEGMLLSNRDTQNSQRGFTQDIENLKVPDNSLVIVGFVYPQFAMSNRDRLELAILHKDKSAISQLSDKGKAVDAAHNITYVWLLNWDDFNHYRQTVQHIYYTIDADRSTEALYGYRVGEFPNTTVMDFGRTPSGEPDTNSTQR